MADEKSYVLVMSYNEFRTLEFHLEKTIIPQISNLDLHNEYRTGRDASTINHILQGMRSLDVAA